MVDRFWTIEVEHGTVASFKTVLRPMLIEVTGSSALSPPAVSPWLFRYPDTLVDVLAAGWLLGRYTGSRLRAPYRFD